MQRASVIVAALFPPEKAGFAPAQMVEGLDDLEDRDRPGIAAQPEAATAAPLALQDSGRGHDLQDLAEKGRRHPQIVRELTAEHERPTLAGTQVGQRPDGVLGGAREYRASPTG
jgi:hypothetical protein